MVAFVAPPLTWALLAGSFLIGLAAVIRMAGPAGGMDHPAGVIRLPRELTATIVTLFVLAALVFVSHVGRRVWYTAQAGGGGAEGDVEVQRVPPWLRAARQIIGLLYFVGARVSPVSRWRLARRDPRARRRRRGDRRQRRRERPERAAARHVELRHPRARRRARRVRPRAVGRDGIAGRSSATTTMWPPHPPPSRPPWTTASRTCAPSRMRAARSFAAMRGSSAPRPSRASRAGPGRRRWSSCARRSAACHSRARPCRRSRGSSSWRATVTTRSGQRSETRRSPRSTRSGRRWRSRTAMPARAKRSRGARSSGGLAVTPRRPRRDARVPGARPIVAHRGRAPGVRGGRRRRVRAGGALGARVAADGGPCSTRRLHRPPAPELDARFLALRDDVRYSIRSRRYFDVILWPRLVELGGRA